MMLPTATSQREHIQCKQALDQRLDEELRQIFSVTDLIALTPPNGQEKDGFDHCEPSVRWG
jgi:hypothetical protein